MKKTILGFAVLALLRGTITSGQDLTAEEDSLKVSTAFFGGGIKVMTRNIYVGADVDRVIAGEPGALDAVMAQLFSTSYPDRAGGLANEILSSRPHLIGIQEASYIAGHITGMGFIEMDYLDILQQVLAAYGLNYTALRSNENVNVTQFFVYLSFGSYQRSFV